MKKTKPKATKASKTTSAVKAAPKKAVKAASKPAAKVAKPALKKAAKPVLKGAKPAAKPASKVDVKAKAGAKPVKTVEKVALKPMATKAAGKAVDKTLSKSPEKPMPKAAVAKATPLAPKASAKTAAAKPAVKPPAKVVEPRVVVPEEPDTAEDVVLTDADGRRYCRTKDCDRLSEVDNYCRYHYILLWKNIQIRRNILQEGKLGRYIEELTARYPDKFLEILKKDLRSEKDFLAAIQELEIDESAVEAEFDDEESQADLFEIQRVSDSGNAGDRSDSDDRF